MQARRRTHLLIILTFIALLFPAQTSTPSESVTRLVVATSTPLETLDPHLVLDSRRADIRLALYDGLFRWQDSPTRIVPWLAQSYTTSEDGRTFRFTLRKEARFHNGQEVKASDVVYSVERILALKRGIAPLLAGVVSPGSTKAVDPLTVEFNLSRASPLFLTLLPEVAIVNAELLKAHEVNNDWGRAWLQTNDAGSGAYSLKSSTPGFGVVVERFASHWSGVPEGNSVEEVALRSILDPEERVRSLLKGDVHVLQGNLLPHHLDQLRRAKYVDVVDIESPRAFIGLLHSGREPMKQPAFRSILAQAFDADQFMSSTLGPNAQPLVVPAPPEFALPATGLTRPRHNLIAAADALAKLKPQLRELVIGAIAGDPHSERAALIMLDALVDLGIPARIVSEPWPAVAARMRDEKQMYDILFFWRGARYLDANNWLGELFDCELFGQGNPSWYCNREADRLIKEARSTADTKARSQGFEKAAAILAEDHAGLFIATGRASVAHLSRVKGLRFLPVGEAIDTLSATIE